MHAAHTAAYAFCQHLNRLRKCNLNMDEKKNILAEKDCNQGDQIGQNFTIWTMF
jgi:hypothetical protein